MHNQKRKADLERKTLKNYEYLNQSNISNPSNINLELPEELKEEEGISMAADAYKNVISDEQFRMYLIERDMAKSDRVTEMNEAIRIGEQKGIQKGLQKGLQKGKLLGLEEGLQKGKLEGREEGIQTERNTTILKLAKYGLDSERISEMLAIEKSIVEKVIKNNI